MPACVNTIASNKATLGLRPARYFRCVAQKLDTGVNVRQMAAAVASGLLLGVAPAAMAQGVSFTSPGAGSTVSSPIHLEMSVQGMEIRPAADGLIPGTGHFHVFVDVAQQPQEGEAIPFDDSHKHYGKGQTEADVELTPGKHTLTLQFANALHESYGPDYASSITVDVQ